MAAGIGKLRITVEIAIRKSRDRPLARQARSAEWKGWKRCGWTGKGGFRFRHSHYPLDYYARREALPVNLSHSTGRAGKPAGPVLDSRFCPDFQTLLKVWAAIFIFFCFLLFRACVSAHLFKCLGRNNSLINQAFKSLLPKLRVCRGDFGQKRKSWAETTQLPPFFFGWF